MIEVGGRPFLFYILRAFRAAQIHEILIVTGYLASYVEKGLGDGKEWGLHLHYQRQEELRGNGDAVLLARDFVGDHSFLLSWGDILCRQENYLGVREKLETSSADGVLAVNWVADPTAGAAVYREGERITGIQEKPPPGASQTHWNQGGIFAFHPTVFDYLVQAPVSARGEVELASAEQAMLDDGRDLRAWEITGPRWNLGTPEEFAALQTTAAQGGWPEGDVTT
jgi:dTDP-glucose pyrophosphorylase